VKLSSAETLSVSTVRVRNTGKTVRINTARVTTADVRPRTASCTSRSRADPPGLGERRPPSRTPCAAAGYARLVSEHTVEIWSDYI
jgi:hypothetical protein